MEIIGDLPVESNITSFKKSHYGTPSVISTMRLMSLFFNYLIEFLLICSGVDFWSCIANGTL